MQLTVKASASLPQEPSEQSLSSATSVIDLEGASVPEPPLKRTNEVFEVLSSPEESMSKKKQRTQMNASRASAVQPKFLNVDVSAATKPSKPTKKASNNKSSSKGSSAAAQNIPLFFQGLSQAELMAEQAAVEFRAKRLLQQKKQRERAEKRQKQQKDQAQSKASNAAPSVFKKIVERTRAPRFPNPSHVIPAETITSTESPAKSSDLQPWWRRDASAGTTTTDIDTAEPPLLPPAESAYAKQPPLVDYLKLALDSIVIAPKTKPKATRLWADVYFNERLLQGFVPEHLKDVSEQMIAFVQSWMAERRNAHDRAAEKQRKLTQQQQNQHRLKKKSSSHASKKCVDDDWFESDAEEDDDGLKNLCHLTGPSGLGKSALVHAVARICGCRVIELNTSDKRGAAAIRKTLEEATQSHSSMELLRDRQGQELSAATLQDSDDEGAGEKHSAVSLILIDEVDNIDASDCGFWMALNDLTKRAKCPIFLTSNEQPEESRVLAWRSLILPVFRPQPVDCVPFMREVLEEEGFILRSNDTRTVQKALSIVAELCNLDMRRIINEFQLFASNQMTKEPVPVVDSDKSLANDCGPSSSTVVLPQVYQVRPAAVRFDQYDLLTIKGSGFMDLASPPVLEGGGYCVHAYVGNHICPAARIMDDETVLAVSPIVHLPIGYSRFGRFHGDEYQSISICGVPMLGHNSTTLGSVAVMELPNGESVLQNNVPVHLQYHFSDVQRGSTEGDSESEAEAEFDESPKATRLSTTRTSSIKHSSCNDETATAGILREGIKAWKGHTVDKQQVLIDGSKLDNLRLSAVATELRSDAAMLEELSSSGLPYLSGACRGFGFDLTDAYPASTNANTKP
jgi:DNA polymerase III delta prime subunit